jgi:hypothetical protein
MTIVGKILVFFNLVFSLVVGAFAVMDFTARTHWARGYADLSRRFEVSEGALAAHKAENEKLVRERQDLNDKLVQLLGKQALPDQANAAQTAAKALTDARALIDNQKVEITTLRERLVAEGKKATNAEASAQALVKDVERRQADVDALRKTLTEETNKTIQLTKANNDLRDRAVAAEITSRSYKDMSARLESQLQDMARDMVRLRQSAGTGIARRGAQPANPPPESVEGLVERTSGNLVTISIGSDAGLLKGHTMEVFRLGQTPTYIGKVRIVEVTANKAVGQAEGRMTVPMRVGDIVSSRIMPR